MSEETLRKLQRTLMDEGAKPPTRVAAAERLADFDAPLALDALVQLAQDQSVDAAVSRAAGQGVAKILIRIGWLDRVPLQDFTESAYLAYDEATARYLRSMPN